MHFQNLILISGATNPIVLSDADDDSDFAGFKKKGSKIFFSDDDDDVDNFSTPKSLVLEGKSQFTHLPFCR